MSACGNCHGTTCSNAGVKTDDKVETESDSENEPDISNTDIYFDGNKMQSPMLLFDDDIPFDDEEEI